MHYKNSFKIWYFRKKIDYYNMTNNIRKKVKNIKKKCLKYKLSFKNNFCLKKYKSKKYKKISFILKPSWLKKDFPYNNKITKLL